MQSSPHRVIDRNSARIFMENSPKRRLLLSMVSRSRTVSDVAASEGVSIGSAHRLLTDFLRRGLVFVEHEEKRAGRPIKHYRTSATSFLVPLEHVSGSPGAGLAAEMRARLDDALYRSEEEGILFYVNSDGDPRVSWFGERQRKEPVAEFWQVIKLRDADALELISELESLLNRYQERAGEGRVFLVHGAVAPRPSS